MVSNIAHLVFPHHKILDALREGSGEAQGSTKSGIAFVAGDKYLREGARLDFSVSDLRELALEGMVKVTEHHGASKIQQREARETVENWINAVEQLKPFLADTVEVVNERLSKGENVLAEGAQGSLLDINHGMYPMVTSSSITVAGLCDGLGVAPKHLGTITGIAKFVRSHVGGGPFVTKIEDEALIESIRGPRGKVDSEFGVTSGRPRDVGYPDLFELTKPIQINGVNRLIFSKIDHASRYGKKVLVATGYSLHDELLSSLPSSAKLLQDCRPVYEEFDTWGDVSEVREYESLPLAAQKFIESAESYLDVPVSFIGVGPERSQVIRR